MALVLTAGLTLASCSQETAHQDADPLRTASPAPSTPALGTVPTRSAAPKPTTRKVFGVPTAPATNDAVALARQLDHAAATLRDRDATARVVRRAAEFQQLAVRALATGSGRFRRTVMVRLDPETTRFLQGDVTAAILLYAMTTAQETLPPWRIVAPPPATELLGYYREAQRRIGVPWTYLAAIHLVETRMGRIRGVSTAGAQGPMQFLPSTWDLYGAGGDINDPRDAIFAAARLLKANGAPGDMADALWHYNQSDNYVRAVTEHARTMQRSKAAYRGYWHWRVLYRHERGTYVLPVGYPERGAVLLPGR